MNPQLRNGLFVGAFLAFATSFGIAEEKQGDGTLAIFGSTLIDATVIIQGMKVQAVGPLNKVIIPERAKKIDVTGKYILPGLIDLHIHTTFPYSELQYHTDSLSLKTIRAMHIMELMLKTGVTSVRDVGAPVEPIQALLRAQELGYLDTIRLFICGRLTTTTGGHGDGVPGNLAVDGPWEFRKAGREMFKVGFHYIKTSPTYTLEEAKAAVDEANTLGLKITSHGDGLTDKTTTSMTRIAVEAGVPCIEHFNVMDDDVLDLIARKDVFIVPTMATYRELYKANEINPYLIQKRRWTLSMQETLLKKPGKERSSWESAPTSSNITWSSTRGST